ncbi:hypothetical protein C8A05DRAFT_35050 [Staphylotrichum tortipilum]|uniref:DUF7689 domain-containing protein n=1 Tax=Staphylotrichum tortipilum TaxID=2831512 RepID=A0AAN6MJD6_9PEZI|nr:hypothetical protein C8A05DRAFT_35050 [Staphylotrichum longicolle]
MAAQLTPEQRFDQWIQSRFINATPGSYTIIPNTQTPVPNCFAYAVGVHDRAILPNNWPELDEAYGQVGYYAIAPNSADADGDVQVYARASDLNRPLHAHRITDAATLGCESKMGGDFAIQHHQGLLQCTRPTSQQMEYGLAVARYRYDEARHKAWLEGEVTTSTGRKLKRKDASYTTSGRPVARGKTATSRSGRVTKRGSSRKPKAKQVPSYKYSGAPPQDPRYVASLRLPAPPRGGFKRPRAKIWGARLCMATVSQGAPARRPAGPVNPHY